MSGEGSGGRRPISKLAIASLVCGIVWMFGIGSLLAVVLGHLARWRIKRRGTRGGGLALAGLVLGYLGLIALMLLFLQNLEFADDVPD